MKYTVNNNNLLKFEYVVSICNKFNKPIRIYEGTGRSKAIKALKNQEKKGNAPRIDVYYFNTKLERYNYFENFFK